MKESIFSKKRILLLGSGELGKELVIESKRLGLEVIAIDRYENCLLYTSPSPRDGLLSRMPSSA